MSDYDEDDHDEFAEEERQVETRPYFELGQVLHCLDDADIKTADVQNNVQALLGENGRLLMQDMLGDEDIWEEDVGTRANKLFLDPTGVHLIVGCDNGENFYFNITFKTKMKFFTNGLTLTGAQAVPTGAAGGGRGVAGAGNQKYYQIESVGWDKHQSFDEVTTGTFLMGTTRDLKVFQAEIFCEGKNPRMEFCNEVQSTFEHMVIVDGDRETNMPPICSVEQDELNGQKLIFVATPSTLVGYAGSSDIDTIEEIMQSAPIQSIQIPMMEGARGSFHIFRTVIGNGAITPPPHSFVWVSQFGVVHGVFAEDASRRKTPLRRGQEEPPLISNTDTIHFGPRNPEGFKKPPTDGVHSSFHMYLMMDEKMVVLGQPAGLKWKPSDGFSLKMQDLQEKTRFNPFAGRVGRCKGIMWDEAKHKAYTFNNSTLYEVTVVNEHAGYWKPFLDRGLDETENAELRERYFGAAMRLTVEFPQKRDIVAMHFGRYWLKKGKKYGKEACRVLDKCSRFEEVYHLLAKERGDLLLPYIKNRYDYLIAQRRQGTEQCQVACLAAAVTALYLDEIASQIEDETMVEEVCEELSSFLHSAHISEPNLFKELQYYLMVHGLIASHGHDSVILSLAKDLKRWRFTVGYSVTCKDYEGAAAILEKNCGDKIDIWVEFGPSLVKTVPMKFLKALKKHKTLQKSIFMLIPAFLQYNQANNEDLALLHPDQLFQFLFDVLQADENKAGARSDLAEVGEAWDVQSPMLRNFYISCLVKNPSYTEDLMRYLGNSDNEYSFEYALRLCLDAKVLPACVILYRALNQPEEAVQVALEVGLVDEAIAVVKELPLDAEEALKKRVWLLLVEYFVDQGDVTDALQYIQESDGALKLEDVLSKVTDTTVIQGFKDPICDRLEVYARNIKELTDDMKNATDSAKSIKDDIATLRARYGYVTQTQRCEICHKSLLHGSAPFLVYPSCRHVVHEACVVDLLEMHGGIRYVAEKCPEPAYLEDITTTTELANAECIFCGEVAILQIEAPFVVAGGDPSWNIKKHTIEVPEVETLTLEL